MKPIDFSDRASLDVGKIQRWPSIDSGNSEYFKSNFPILVRMFDEHDRIRLEDEIIANDWAEGYLE